MNNSWLTNGIETDAWLPRFNALLAGALFLTNEANLWIRTCFHRLNLEPKLNGEQAGANQQEYNAGRVIGMLERNLMYMIIVLGNNFAAVGFILAAKGFARFKLLDERQFAEYVLIGTLASTFITLLLAVLVRAYVM